jgi:hypothetical protein
MEDRSSIETPAQALAQFETIGMVPRLFAFRMRCEYAHGVRDLRS